MTNVSCNRNDIEQMIYLLCNYSAKASSSLNHIIILLILQIDTFYYPFTSEIQSATHELNEHAKKKQTVENYIDLKEHYQSDNHKNNDTELQ